MCRTTLTYLPRCPPTPDDVDGRIRSAALLENMGDLESWKGNYTEGLSHLEQALLAYEQDGDEIGIASVLRKQAAVYYRHSYHLNALKVAVGALEKCRNLNDLLGTAEALYIMGSSLAIQTKNTEATPFLEEALEIFQTNGNNVGVVQCLERIGEVQRREWRYVEAYSNLERAVEIARQCGDKLGEAKALLILGLAYSGQGDRARGASTLSETCDMARRIGWEHGISTSLLRLGNHESFNGRYREAEELCRESIAVARRSNEELSRIPMTAMTWERRKRRKPVLSTNSSVSSASPLLCDIRRLQRRMPQIATANLKLPIRPNDPNGA